MADPPDGIVVAHLATSEASQPRTAEVGVGLIWQLAFPRC